MRWFLSLLASCFIAAAAVHPLTVSTSTVLSLSGSGAVTGTTAAGFPFSVSGTGTLTNIGAVTFTGTGVISDISNLQFNSQVATMVVLTTASGATINITINVPAGYLVTSLSGDAASASGSGTVTGGTGAFANATGSFPTITGSGTATGPFSANIMLQGSGTIVTAGPLSGSAPSISPGGVITATQYGASTVLAPGTWIEIYGTNLATSTRQWAAGDFTNNGLSAPTSLDGVTVTVGGQPAYVDYVSPTQVNALIASNAQTGPATLVLANNLGTTAPYSVTIQATQPGLLAPSTLLINGKQYIGSLNATQSGYEGTPSSPAKAGDVIVVYGIGFGPVTPTTNAGTVATSATTLNTKPQISFGSTPVTFNYAGLTPGFTNLYQFNIVVPAVSTNSALPVTVNLGGISGTQTLYIAIQ